MVDRRDYPILLSIWSYVIFIFSSGYIYKFRTSGIVGMRLGHGRRLGLSRWARLFFFFLRNFMVEDCWRAGWFFLVFISIAIFMERITV